MEPEYKLKFKLYWEVENPKTTKLKCTFCDGSGVAERFDDFPYMNFGDCPVCDKMGYFEQVDKKQYPKDAVRKWFENVNTNKNG